MTAARILTAWAAANALTVALLVARAHHAHRRTARQAARQALRDTYSREALAIAARRAHHIAAYVAAAEVAAQPGPAVAAAMHRHPSAPGHAAAQLTQHLAAGCDGSCPTALNLLWLTGTAPQSEQRA